MKSLKKNIIVILLLLGTLTLAACGAEKKKEEQNKGTTPTLVPTATIDKEQLKQVKKIGNGTVVWMMPGGFGELSEKKINLLNKRLIADGYTCTLSVQYVPQEIYEEKGLEDLKTGDTDIALLGLFYATETHEAAYWIRQNVLEELSDYLETEQGQMLKNEFPEELWKSVETDGGIYSVPGQDSIDGTGYYVFNKDYFSKEEVENFSGTLEELKTMLLEKDFPEDIVPFLLRDSMDQWENMIGYQSVYGTLVNLQTGKAYSPYEVPEYIQVLEQLHSMKEAGLSSWGAGDKEKKIIENGQFAVWLSGNYDVMFEKAKENSFLVHRPYAFRSKVSCTTAVGKSARHKEEALQLLTLLYTSAEYANLLFYGEENVDYQIKDGYACSMDGNKISLGFQQMITGIHNHVLPCDGDFLTVNRMETRKQIYQSPAKLENCILGFQPDCTRFDEKMLELGGEVDWNHRMWADDNFEELLAKAKEEYKEAGGDKLVEEMNRQIEAWMAEYGTK